MTSTVAGWVLAEGHSADGTVLDHGVLGLRSGTGMRAMHTAEQVAAEVLRVHATCDRLRVIGVTWRDDAAAEAALLVEALTGAGLDNVVPVRQLHAVEALAEATASVIGLARTVVCVLEDEWTTTVMVDSGDDGDGTGVKQVPGGPDGLMRWLTDMFKHNAWQPDAVVLIGSDGDVDFVAGQLEEVLTVPTFRQPNASLAVARGAALAAAQSTEFTDARLVAIAGEGCAVPARSRRLSYAGALTGLVAGAVTLVASLSLTVGLRLAPQRDPGDVEPAVRPATPQIAQAHTPAIAPPPAVKAPVAEPVQEPAPAPKVTPAPASPVQVAMPEPVQAEEVVAIPPAATQVTLQEQTNVPPAPPEPNSRPPLLTRLLEHLQGFDDH